ncbi:MAG: DUF2935 domain-containing protein [Clostridiales bacterium]|jgi:hypothetical protein|nr:DUF2935 domain-containing protein [Eubacteriales bacterium]MDH7567011.1 DUF2935 domain-containing protein [Clostridiales bacterium]
MFNPLEEIYFWSGIMRDHAEFMLISLSAREQPSVSAAGYFKNTFMELRRRAKDLPAAEDSPRSVMELVRQSMSAVTGFIDFKRLLAGRSLQCKLEISLSPTFINHMINEAMEYFQTLCMLQAIRPVNRIMKNIRLHKVWLADAAGHAATIAADLDPVEAALIKEAEEFKNAFDHLFIKAMELGALLERTGLSDGALSHFNTEVEAKINDFIYFLDKIRMLRKECKILGTLKPLMPDHMMREEKYYLYKIRNLRTVT